MPLPPGAEPPGTISRDCSCRCILFGLFDQVLHEFLHGLGKFVHSLLEVFGIDRELNGHGALLGVNLGLPDKKNRAGFIRLPILLDRRQPADRANRQIAENLFQVKVLLIEFGFFPCFFRVLS